MTKQTCPFYKTRDLNSCLLNLHSLTSINFICNFVCAFTSHHQHPLQGRSSSEDCHPDKISHYAHLVPAAELYFCSNNIFYVKFYFYLPPGRVSRHIFWRPSWQLLSLFNLWLDLLLLSGGRVFSKRSPDEVGSQFTRRGLQCGTLVMLIGSSPMSTCTNRADGKTNLVRAFDQTNI
jgi:hypothetical protein